MNTMRSSSINKSFAYAAISTITLISLFAVTDFSTAATAKATTGKAKFVAVGSVVAVSPSSVTVNVTSANKGSNLKGKSQAFSIKSSTRVTKKGGGDKNIKPVNLKVGMKVKIFGIINKITGEITAIWVKILSTKI